MGVSLLMKNANVAADVQKLMSLNPSSSKSISDHESNEETLPLDAPREPSVGQCAGFCANQPENCITMHESCGGCPECHESNKEPQPLDAPTQSISDGTDAVPSQPEG